MSRRLLLIVAIGAAAQAGCAVQAPPRCPAGEQASISELVYFGTAKPGGVVSADDWASYLAQSVTPRFPAGLTAWPAAGQWRSSEGAVVKETSLVLNLVYAPSDTNEAAIRALVSEYKQRFQQEAVLRVKAQVCAAI